MFKEFWMEEDSIAFVGNLLILVALIIIAIIIVIISAIIFRNIIIDWINDLYCDGGSGFNPEMIE